MDLQQTVTLAIVLLAAVSLMYRLVMRLRCGGSGSGTCPGCGNCGKRPRRRLFGLLRS